MIAYLCIFIFSINSFAYLPPAFFIYQQIAQTKEKQQPPTSLLLKISRPKGSGIEEPIGALAVPAIKAATNGWPSLSLLLAETPEQLMQSIASFGIPITKEQDLLRASKDQILAMREAPKPYYKTDKRMSLRRLRQTYAWVHKEGEKEIWVEKDTFLPLKIVAPCPREIVDLSWATAGKNICELEFRNIYALKRGAYSSSRMLLWKDSIPVLFLTFDKPSASPLQPPTEEIQAIANILLH